MAASLGYEAMGVDMSTRAIELAETKASERGVEARFVVADALRLIDLGEQFDTVLDCGLFHVFDDDERGRYVASLAAVVPPGGRYHMLCFSDRQPGDWGPRRVTQDEIQVAFVRGMEHRIHRVRRHRHHLGPRRSPGLAGRGDSQLEVAAQARAQASAAPLMAANVAPMPSFAASRRMPISFAASSPNIFSKNAEPSGGSSQVSVTSVPPSTGAKE